MLKSSVPQPLLFQVCQIYSKGLRKCSHSRPSVERYKFSWMWRTEIQKNQKKGIQRVWLLIFFLVYDSYFQLSELLFKWDANLLSQILLPLNINIFMGTLCREKNIGNGIQAKLIHRIFSNASDPSLTDGTIIEYSFWLLEL